MTDGPTIKTTEYLDGFQYYKGILQFFPTSEGYVKNTVLNGQMTFDYVYNYTDHLGNVRVSYTKDPETEEIVILEENHYYPFGLKHSLYADNKNKIEAINNNTQKAVNPDDPVDVNSVYARYDVKYNGKEWQDELGLGVYDYGWRNYDPAIARWGSIDFYSEKYPTINPYNYVTNNPISAIDPDGRDVYFVIVVNGGAADGYDAAKTRKKEIENSKGFDSKKDHVYFLEVSDLSTLSSTVADKVKDAEDNGYGSTVEASFFGHFGGDGPVGVSPMNNDELSDVSGYSTEKGQLSPDGWKKINWNWDSSNSIIGFYGCQSASFAEKYLDYDSKVKYAAGLGGSAGGSYTYEGQFNAVWSNWRGKSVYMVDKDNGKVNPRFVYERGDVVKPAFNWTQYGVRHSMKNSSSIYGNVTVKDGKAVNGSN